ncbi:MAG: 3' terminal RNA ribose 2'-O-methyltransferase Hen1 [Actinomycetota bacterium]|nr:3' terminal RNA ribose 2'-O-methyltransferase Hen1 [Rubrobacteraceae bacterium]MDQ3251667.1 3' terminal RNA ribose 2'-O-methyltransferase Hen1 [Actinomycetota bacterium]
MLLTITSTNPPATDLGYLLHKNPSRCQSFDLPFGTAHVFYPEASDRRCMVAMLLEIDPVGLVRGEGRTLKEYVNDRPYAASSFLSVAISRVFGTAMRGRSKERPELALTPLSLGVGISVLPCREGEDFLRRLFEPLGYSVLAEQHQLDEEFPEWGESRYFTVGLSGEVRLQDLLSHLYVLVPVLDDDKHYWVGDDEVDKLLERGGEWLAAHPEREVIAKRYLKHQRTLSNEALSRLIEEEDVGLEREEEALEEIITLGEQRIGAVAAALKNSGARRVLDLGCGEGRLLGALLQERSFEEIVGVDVSVRSLKRARDRLRVDRLPPMQQSRLKLFQGSLLYRDRRLAGYDAAAVVEVIEHLDPPRLAAFERVLFGFARPGTVVLTTPNAEYNANFESLPAGEFRHRDHRFEWNREEFRAWSNGVAENFGYGVRYLPVGSEDEAVGPPTQMAVFERESPREQREESS